jgi:molybdate transport system substrate-binding protein
MVPIGSRNPSTEPADLVVLSAGAMHAILDEAIGMFNGTCKMRIDARFATSNGVKARILAGEDVDVAISTQSAIDELHQAGKLVPDSAVPLARSAIGIAVRAGAPKPDIGSVESIRRALHHARTIAVADPSTGSPSANHFFHMVERLGLTSELQPKLRLVGGGAGKVVVVGELVARGDAEIGFQQIAEILAVPGVDLVGRLPTELQHITVFSGAIPATSKHAETAHRLLDFLSSPATASTVLAKGMESVRGTQSALGRL